MGSVKAHVLSDTRRDIHSAKSTQHACTDLFNTANFLNILFDRDKQ